MINYFPLHSWLEINTTVHVLKSTRLKVKQNAKQIR